MLRDHAAPLRRPIIGYNTALDGMALLFAEAEIARATRGHW